MFTPTVKYYEWDRITIGVTIKVIYGDPETVPAVVGTHTAYVERTNLTSRRMNRRLVRKTRSYSKQLAALAVSCVWEDWVGNLTRPLNKLASWVHAGQHSWYPTPVCEPFRDASAL
jgi:hypothetical protein